MDGLYFGPEVLAMASKKLFNLEIPEAPIVFINVDELFSDFVVILKDKALFSRSIPLGAQAFAQGEESFLRFREEVKKSLDAYLSEDIDKSPHLVILGGATQSLVPLKDILKETLPFPLEMVSEFKGLLVEKEAKKAVSLGSKVSFLNLISSLLGLPEVEINIIPEEIKLKMDLEQKSKELIKTGIFLIVIFILSFSIILSKIYFKSLYLKKIKTQYAQTIEEAKRLEDDYTKVNLIQSYLSKRGSSLQVLRELYNIIPSDVEFTDVRLDDKGRLSLRGVAENMSSVFSLVEGMSKSNYFKEVRTRYTTKRREGASDVTDFEINSLVEQAGIFNG